MTGSIEFTVYRGSKDGTITKGQTRREIGLNDAVVKVTHSGVCATDEHALQFGCVLGHEGIGIVTEIGSSVTAVKVGDRVGFGYVHYYCGHCEQCLTGMDVFCENNRQYIIDDTDEGSFGSHVVWDAKALYPIPRELDSAHAAPLMCGGATVWGAISLYGLKPTHRVGVIGIGGLGHLAIQFAAKMGCEVVAFSGTDSKREEAKKFGAVEFHTTKGLKEFTGIKKLDQLLITTSEQPNYALYLSIMKPNSTILPLTVDFGETPVPFLKVLTNGIRIQGSAEAPHIEFTRMLDFAVQHDIRPQIVEYPMTKEGIETAMKTLREGKMRYRGVLVAPQ